MSERLTDEELDDAEYRAREWLHCETHHVTRANAINEEVMALDVLALLSELRALRAQALTEEELDVLRKLHTAMTAGPWVGWSLSDQALSLLDRLLAWVNDRAR